MDEIKLGRELILLFAKAFEYFVKVTSKKLQIITFEDLTSNGRYLFLQDYLIRRWHISNAVYIKNILFYCTDEYSIS